VLFLTSLFLLFAVFVVPQKTKYHRRISSVQSTKMIQAPKANALIMKKQEGGRAKKWMLVTQQIRSEQLHPLLLLLLPFV
jgi:hypothetical protein